MSAYSIEFHIDDLPRMTNNGSRASTHWRFVQADRKKWHALVAAKVGRRKPYEPLARAYLTLIRYSSTPPDFDGLVSGFKPVVDGLKRAGVLLDDKLTNTGQWHCSWQKAKPKQGKIYVRVDEVAPSADLDIA